MWPGFKGEGLNMTRQKKEIIKKIDYILLGMEMDDLMG